MNAAWLNGETLGEGGLPWTARGLHYGDGIFRTCLSIDSELVDLEQHISKAIEDGARLELAVDAAQLGRQLQLAAGPGAAVVKASLWRRGSGRGYAGQGREVDILVSRQPLPDWPASHWRDGIRLAVSPVRLAAQPRLAGIKHLNRLEQVLVARALDHADEAVCLDHDGHLVGGGRSNLFWVRDGQLQTPLLDRCGIAGIMRARILALAPTLGRAVQIVRQPLAALETAEEVFVSNALIGIWPVRAVGSRMLAPGPVTRALQAALQHPLPDPSASCAT